MYSSTRNWLDYDLIYHLSGRGAQFPSDFRCYYAPQIRGTLTSLWERAEVRETDIAIRTLIFGVARIAMSVRSRPILRSEQEQRKGSLAMPAKPYRIVATDPSPTAPDLPLVRAPLGRKYVAPALRAGPAG